VVFWSCKEVFDMLEECELKQKNKEEKSVSFEDTSISSVVLL